AQQNLQPPDRIAALFRIEIANKHLEDAADRGIARALPHGFAQSWKARAKWLVAAPPELDPLIAESRNRPPFLDVGFAWDDVFLTGQLHSSHLKIRARPAARPAGFPTAGHRHAANPWPRSDG